VIIIKSDKDVKYGIFLPIRGISDSGLKNKGPTPYNMSVLSLVHGLWQPT
jgi:hypothetical protein